jgi:hypothetical protein
MRMTRCISIAALLLLAGCGPDSPAVPNLDDASAVHAHAAGPAGSAAANLDATADLARVRAATAKYQQFERAQADGYTLQLTECAEIADGAMGYHYGKEALIDAVVELTRPEALMYEPLPNGRLRLIGVEYIVPYTVWPRENNPPRLFNRDFEQNETFGIWALHAWIWQANPEGVFAPWNPLVSCRHAQD